jgi:hypothetical protein
VSIGDTSEEQNAAQIGLAENRRMIAYRGTPVRWNEKIIDHV